jgi:hypothetical protein
MSTKFVQIKAIGLKWAPLQGVIDFPYMCLVRKSFKSLVLIAASGFIAVIHFSQQTVNFHSNQQTLTFHSND